MMMGTFVLNGLKLNILLVENEQREKPNID